VDYGKPIKASWLGIRVVYQNQIKISCMETLPIFTFCFLALAIQGGSPNLSKIV
jgi:hypothetical protein